MKFLFPGFLFALAAILIPILIHLFSFRKFTTVYFSNVSYLKNIKNESQRKSRLRNLLILISRIMAVAALVFVFAQPYLPVQREGITRPDPVVSVYIDNSFSMNAVSTEGQLLEIARNKAVEIAESYSPGTRYLLITNDLLPQHRHIFNREQFIQQVSEIKSSSRSVPLSEIRNQMVNNALTIDGDASVLAYYLSDFQVNTTDLDHFVSDTGHVNVFLPLTGSTRNNLYIDSCWMEVPAHKIGQEEILNVKIVNDSPEAYQNLPVKFYLEDTLKALSNFNIEPGKELTIQLKYLNYSGGVHCGKVEISDYPYTYDNTYYLNYFVQSQLKTLAVYDGNYGKTSGLPYLNALFGDDDYIVLETSTVDNLQVSKLDNYNTLFLLNVREISSGLGHELKKSAENGAAVVIFPEPEGNLILYNNFFQLFNANLILRFDTTTMNITGIEWEHPVYREVFSERSDDLDLPAIKGHFIFSQNIRIPETPLLWFRNREKAASSQTTGDGHLIVFSFPLSTLNSSFAMDPLFVPTLYSLVINSLPGQKISYTIGKETGAIVSRHNIPDFSSLLIEKSDSSGEFIPPVTVSEGNRLKINFQNYFNTAGHYRIKSAGKTVSAVSMNYDRAESDLNFFSSAGLTAEIEKYHLQNCSAVEIQTKHFSQVYDEIRHGHRLWKIFLLLALLFILTEAAIIRLWD